MRHLLIFDPGMLSAFGHHYAYNSALRDAAKALGMEARWLCSNQLPAELGAEFPLAPQFLPWSTYGVLSSFPAIPDATVPAVVARLAGDIAHCFDAARPFPDLVFAHTLESALFLALLLWHAGLPRRERPAMALNLMLDLDEGERCRMLLEQAATLLTAAPDVALFAGTRSAVDLLAALTGRKAAMLPSPLPAWLDDCVSPPNQSGPLFSLFGDGRAGKNLHVLPTALMHYLRNGGKGRFALHMTPTDGGLHDIFITLDDLHRQFPNRITLALQRLDERDYYASFGAADALIIPYEASAYTRFRPSGLVIESAALGVPAICAKGGFMEEELGRLDNGSLFLESISPASLSQAFFLFEKEYVARKEQAIARAAEYRRVHNARAVLELVLGG